jgi:hypothetical protein
LSDKTKFEVLLRDLKDLNDGLFSLLRFSELRSVNIGVQSSVLRAADRIDEISTLSSVCEAYLLEPAVPGDNAAQRQISAYRELLPATQAKRVLLQQSFRTEIPSGISVSRDVSDGLKKGMSDVKGYPSQTPSSVRVLGEYHDATILLEWKDVDNTTPYSTLVSRRIDNLAQLLSASTTKPEDFRVLECCGYFFDDTHSRYGYIFRLPPQCAVRVPATLHDMMRRVGPNDRIPVLGDRFRLARVLALSMLRLHDCGWIHTAFRSDSVLFFYPEESGLDADTHQLDHAYLSGFGYSKPSDPAESTIEVSQPNREHDLYRHPDIVSARANPFRTQRTRQHQRHDLYSLGIVLLEIGLWEQVRSLWKQKYTPEEFLDKLLRTYVPKLGYKMGAIYRDVVHDLLSMEIQAFPSEVPDLRSIVRSAASSGFDEDGPASGFSGSDWWNIVVRLENCNA